MHIREVSGANIVGNTRGLEPSNILVLVIYNEFSPKITTAQVCLNDVSPEEI